MCLLLVPYPQPLGTHEVWGFYSSAACGLPDTGLSREAWGQGCSPTPSLTPKSHHLPKGLLPWVLTLHAASFFSLPTPAQKSCWKSRAQMPMAHTGMP